MLQTIWLSDGLKTFLCLIYDIHHRDNCKCKFWCLLAVF